jgi:hypothetical protein
MRNGRPEKRLGLCKEAEATASLLKKEGNKDAVDRVSVAKKMARWKELNNKLEQAFAVKA